MYMPENDEQMFDILSALRLYASANALHGLAEEIDDALILLTVGPEGQAGAEARGSRILPGARDRH